MKWMIEAAQVGKTFSSFIAVLVLAAFSLGAWGVESAGTVKTLVGSATVARDSSVLVVVTGQRIFPGDRISTSPESYVGITLHDDTRLTIGPGSEVLIREFDFNPSSYVGGLAVSFLKGTARVITGIIAKHAPQRVSFSTQTMTIGIRGTDFIVDLEEQE
jgi:hypothetical protein